MHRRNWRTVLLGALALGCLAGSETLATAAQDAPAPAAPPQVAPASTQRLTLDEVKQRILANNKLLQLAAHNVQSKGYATRAVRALYFPQVIGSSVYFHFNDNLGSVLSSQGRTITGPLGRPLVTFPAGSALIPLVEQDSSFTMITMVQPITDLLKVRQGVKLAQADEQIAQAMMEKGTRELLSGVEQLYWGLLAAERIRGGTLAAIAGAEEVAKSGNLEARVALLEAKQGLQQVNNQIADLQEQLAILLDVPVCTQFELVEPPQPVAPVNCADEAVNLAVQSSPEIREAEQNICKARAAICAEKVEYLPSVAVVGGYANNSGMIDVIQPNFGYVGAIATYTFVDWGKRRNTLHERQELLAMAILKVQQTQDEVRQNALKAYREYDETDKALKLAEEMVGVRTQAAQAATALADKLKAAKDLGIAQVDVVKADLAHRFAYVKLMSLLGKP